jgi:hypothetical protein
LLLVWKLIHGIPAISKSLSDHPNGKWFRSPCPGYKAGSGIKDLVEKFGHDFYKNYVQF